jgi:hypothetical protein
MKELLPVAILVGGAIIAVVIISQTYANTQAANAKAASQNAEAADISGGENLLNTVLGG